MGLVQIRTEDKGRGKRPPNPSALFLGGWGGDVQTLPPAFPENRQQQITWEFLQLLLALSCVEGT